MFLAVLVACCLTICRAYVLDEELPQEQLQKFTSQVLEEAQTQLSGYKRLPDVNFDFEQVYFTIPVKLALIIRNNTLIGPTALSTVGLITGQQLLSGSATVFTTVSLGELKVGYSDIRINFFGLEFEGPAEIYVAQPEVSLSLHIYRNVLTSCQATASLNRPSGKVRISFGNNGSIIKLVMIAVENILNWVILPYWLIDWCFFPDVSPQLEQIIEEAASKIACR